MNSAPPPTPTPAPARDPRKVDQDHLRLLVIFHFIFAGLAVLGIAFLFLHFTLMHTVLTNPGIWANQKGGAPPVDLIFSIARWFYAGAGVLLVLGGIANALSAQFIRKRKHRIFSLVVSGLNCLQLPIGTALGVFSILVLSRDSVLQLYEAPSA